MGAFLSALGFLTVFPVPAGASSPTQLSRGRVWFPVVGAVLGLALAGMDAGLHLILPLGVTSALIVVALVFATRALHLDGLMDAADGALGGNTPERRLEIMRDPHVGAFGVAAAAAVMLVKWSALASLAGETRFWAIAVFPLVSRWSMVLAMSAFQYARSQGIGTAFQDRSVRFTSGLATLFALGAAFLLGTWGGLVMIGAGYLVAVVLGAALARALGGLTGDTYGAINEVTETVALVVAAALVPLAVLRPVPNL